MSATGNRVKDMIILVLANNDVGLYKFRKELLGKLLENNRLYISLPKGNLVPRLIEMGCIYIETNVDRRGMNPIRDGQLMMAYERLIHRIKPDLIITYTIKPNIYGGMAAAFHKITYAVNITGLGTAFQKEGMMKKLVIFLYKRALRSAKIVFFENQENQKLFLSERIVRESQGCLLPGAGVSLKEFREVPFPRNGNTVFLFVGRIMKEKGIEELIWAAEQIKREFRNVLVQVVGPMEESYEEQMKRLEKEGVLHYYGFQYDVKPFFKGCHCFVLPSYHEGMANTLLEAAATGRPLITTDIAGCREAVAEGENGFLVPKQDAEQLYCAMKTFMKLPYEKKVEMGRTSRKLMETAFDKALVVKKTVRRIIE